MYKMCKTEQSAKRQREIEMTLMRLMQTKRFDDVSVSEICDEMKMPRKAFYRYFDSRDGALNALIDHTLMDFERFNDEYEKKSAPTSKRLLKNELERFFLFWTLPEKKMLLDALERSNLTGLLIQSSVDFSNSSFVNPKKFLPDESDWMRTELLRFAICGLMSVTLGWYREGFVTDISDMAIAAARMLSKPLFPSLSKLGFSWTLPNLCSIKHTPIVERSQKQLKCPIVKEIWKA